MIRGFLLSAAALSLAACSSQTVSDAPKKITDKIVSQSAAVSGFDKTIAAAERSLEVAMRAPLTIPTPKDPGGGYTHETHKANGFMLYDIGQLYKLTGEKKYAEFAGQAMLDYAEVYPGYGIHPAKKEQSPGRMFWQNLNAVSYTHLTLPTTPYV